eukprot:g59149.t1
MTDTLDEEEVGDTGAHHNLNAEALQPAIATAARRLQKSDVLTLDVGGTIFRTRVETLTTHSGFFKDLLLSEGAIEVDLNQPLFLDLDPETFNLILQFFRSKSPDALFGCLAWYYPNQVKPSLDRFKCEVKPYERSYNMRFGFCRVCWIPLGYADEEYDAHQVCDQINTRCIDDQRSNYGDTYCAKCGTKEKVVGVHSSLNNTFHWTDNVIRSSHSKPAADMHSVVYQLRYLQVAPFAEFLKWPRWIMPDNGGSSAAASEKKQFK